MRSLENNLDFLVLVAAAAGNLAVPPTTSSVVPASWLIAPLNAAVPEMSLEVWSDGVTNLTGAALYAATVHPLVSAPVAAISDGGDGTTLAKVAHGYLTGDGPVLLSAATSLPTGLPGATDLWIIKVDADHFKVATSLAHALAGTAVAFTTGSGVGAITSTPDASFSRVAWNQHSLLGVASDGALALDASKGYVRHGLRHSPRTIAYSLSATSSDGTKHLSASLYPLREL